MLGAITQAKEKRTTPIRIDHHTAQK